MASDPKEALRQAATRAHREGRLDEALEGYTRYLARSPQDAGVWTNLGALFRSQSRHDKARIAQARAYALDPDLAGVRNNYANILSDLGDYEKSIELRTAALKDDPSNLMNHAMIGRCYRGLGRYQEAIDYLTPLSGLFQDEPELELQLAFAQLGAGQYGAAFRSYQSRWKTGDLTLPDLPYPRWQEGMEVDGKSILVVPEQGFGDAILFSRFVRLLADKGASVHFAAKPPLQRLLQGLDGAVVVGGRSKETTYDCWMSLMDLPLVVYGPQDKGEVPPPAKLSVPADSQDRARAVTANHRGLFKVGIVWSGSATYKGNAFRSFSHREMLPLTEVGGVQLFSLYKGPFLDAFQKDGSAAIIIDTASTDRDFADCAAMMQEMDLVITSDTATAHIAGSLGVNVWTILHWDPFWVFRHEGDTTEWYPNMRLFRQQTPLQWGQVFDDVQAALQQEVSTHG